MTARPQSSLPPDYFERMFSTTPDPWQFETSRYETEKYDATLAALRGRVYARGFEVGCANGVLTLRLSQSCDHLTAIDVSNSALARARKRCDGLVNISFDRMIFPKQCPVETFDLIVLSEVAYYWDSEDMATAIAWIQRHLRAGGDLLLVHWIGDTDYPQSGDDAVGLLAHGLVGYGVEISQRTDKYRLDLWRRDSE